MEIREYTFFDLQFDLLIISCKKTLTHSVDYRPDLLIVVFVIEENAIKTRTLCTFSVSEIDM